MIAFRTLCGSALAVAIALAGPADAATASRGEPHALLLLSAPGPTAKQPLASMRTIYQHDWRDLSGACPSLRTLSPFLARFVKGKIPYVRLMAGGSDTTAACTCLGTVQRDFRCLMLPYQPRDILGKLFPEEKQDTLPLLVPPPHQPRPTLEPPLPPERQPLPPAQTAMRPPSPPEFGAPRPTVPGVGKPVYVVEVTDCRGAGGNWALFYEGQVLEAGQDSMRVRLDRRFALRHHAEYTGEDPENWWCIPKRRYCYSPVDFTGWGGSHTAAEIAEFPARSILDASAGPAAALGPHLDAQCRAARH